MRFGHLAPEYGGPDSDDNLVVVRLYDRAPDQTPQNRLVNRTARRRAQATLLGRVTVEFAPGEHQPPAPVLTCKLDWSDGFEGRELHRFPWGRVLTAARAFRDARRHNGLEHWQNYGRHLRHVGPGEPVRATPGRPAKPQQFYLDIARRYQELLIEGCGSPTLTISQEHAVPRSTAASWVKRARDKGVLAKGKAGRVG